MRTRTFLRSGSGFTLIELVVVVAIIGILAAIIWPLVSGFIDRAENVSVVADVAAVQRASDLFKLDRHKGPDGSFEWGQGSRGHFLPARDGAGGDLELNRDVDDPDRPGNLRVDKHLAGLGTNGPAGDVDIGNALVWIGLLVNEPADNSGSEQQTTGDARPQGGEDGPYLPQFPSNAHADNTERDGGGGYTDGAFRFVLLHNEQVVAAYKSGSSWFAALRDSSVIAGPSRVTSGLVVLYEFNEGSGSTVGDTSGVGTPLNLTIDSVPNVTWLSGALRINSGTIVKSSGAGTKVFDALTATDKITIEAWVKPANNTQTGPARIVTLSKDTSKRNFTLGQDADEYITRLRTDDGSTSSNGTPSQDTGTGTLTTSLTHVVFTYDSSTTARKTYIDGSVAVSDTGGTGGIAGDFDNWDSSWKFALANELNNNWDWLGEFHLVAIFDRALSASEVSQNFNAGP